MVQRKRSAEERGRGGPTPQRTRGIPHLGSCAFPPSRRSRGEVSSPSSVESTGVTATPEGVVVVAAAAAAVVFDF